MVSMAKNCLWASDESSVLEASSLEPHAHREKSMARQRSSASVLDNSKFLMWQV